jgi:hypothetical protein
MNSKPRIHKIAEFAAAAPGMAAALYAAIAYDQGATDGILVSTFAAIADWQAGFFDGSYYPKLAMLMMALPLMVPPLILVKLAFWRTGSAD